MCVGSETSALDGARAGGGGCGSPGHPGAGSSAAAHLRALKTVRSRAGAVALEKCILTKLVHCTCAEFNARRAIWLFAIIGFPFP